MEQITVRDLTFSYSKDSNFSLKNVTFSVEKGEIFLITGVSGCGKTTLLRHLKMDYMPQGIRESSGAVLINGKRIKELSEREQAQVVGFVGQNVENLQVTDKVWHELAFGLENLGYARDIMERKIAEMTAFFGLEAVYHEKLCNLSGGQRQLVNLASVMAMEPEILVMDEPTSQLDPVAATEFFRMIEKISREMGTTIVMTEHRLEEVFPLCHRVMVMEQGTVLGIGTPQQVAGILYEQKNLLYPALPSAARLYLELQGCGEEIPLTVNEGRRYLETLCKKSEDAKWKQDSREKHNSGRKKELLQRPVLQADEVWFRYDRNGRDVLKACSLQLEKGKITAILGGNGAGKSTLLYLLAGKIQAYSGKVKTMEESIGFLPQNPQAMFAKKTVLEELGEDRKRQNIIELCDLEEVLSRHPFDLSGGQMQKLAMAKLLLQDADVFLLDEPTKGMDYAFKEEMGVLLKRLADGGKSILMVSHDVEFCAKYADICGMFFDGHVVSLEDRRRFFLDNVFYTTSVVRMCRGMLPDAIVLEDVLEQFPQLKSDKKEKLEKGFQTVKQDTAELQATELQAEKLQTAQGKEREKDIQRKETERVKKPFSFSGWMIYGLVFLVMPFTIYVGDAVLDQRKYYFISLLLVIEGLAAFFLSFEKKKPKIREIMVIAVFSAIVAAARAAFYMLPDVKPMAALVIIAGVGLGKESGFLVGAMSMLVSNIFFGQGPWTPWQMFAMGILGFLAGVIFKQTTPCSQKKKYGICFFGLTAVLVVYGGIMNTSTALTYQENVNLQMILASCALGLPYDAIHAGVTFAFLWIGVRPMLEKIDRVRKKYYTIR